MHVREYDLSLYLRKLADGTLFWTILCHWGIHQWISVYECSNFKPYCPCDSFFFSSCDSLSFSSFDISLSIVYMLPHCFCIEPYPIIVTYSKTKSHRSFQSFDTLRKGISKGEITGLIYWLIFIFDRTSRRYSHRLSE